MPMHTKPLQTNPTKSLPLIEARRLLIRCLLAVSTLAFALLAVGCADTSYYLQSVGGHLKMLQAARPVDQWLLDDAVEPALKQRLELAQRIRRFAVSDLGLPDNASYQRYADLQRRAVVWNVVAAPELSLTLKTWCFPVAGCVSYRGYFSEADAQGLAAHLKAQGLEVSVYGVPAYSTLGWLNWAGGDPLLNTFIGYPEGELARMIFHELAHQVLYVKDDTLFNESFATAVERLGGERWLAAHGSPQARAEYAQFDARRRQFRALLMTTRQKLAQIYKENEPLAHDIQAQAAMKNIAMQEFRTDFAALKTAWGGYSGYDAWVAGANNAAFGAQAVYDDLVPSFEALFVAQGKDWKRFYEAVKQLTQLPAAQRIRTLKQLSTEHPSG
jgi:predicted aminopeptidase